MSSGREIQDLELGHHRHVSGFSIPGSCSTLPGDRGGRRGGSVLSPTSVQLFKRMVRVIRDVFCSIVLYFPVGITVSLEPEHLEPTTNTRFSYRMAENPSHSK